MTRSTFGATAPNQRRSSNPKGEDEKKIRRILSLTLARARQGVLAHRLVVVHALGASSTRWPLAAQGCPNTKIMFEHLMKQIVACGNN